MDMNTGRAVRIYRTGRIHPADGEGMIAFYKNLPYEDMLSSQKVRIELKPCDLPGMPIEDVDCEICGENVCDSRHKVVGGEIMCRSCAEGGYYSPV
jgi:formylmethanofuran dehydrogenase subunit E